MVCARGLCARKTETREKEKSDSSSSSSKDDSSLATKPADHDEARSSSQKKKLQQYSRARSEIRYGILSRSPSLRRRATYKELLAVLRRLHSGLSGVSSRLILDYVQARVVAVPPAVYITFVIVVATDSARRPEVFSSSSSSVCDIYTRHA